jgi:hypothetical protein
MLKNTIENYKKAKEVYLDIDDKYYDIEQGNIKNTEFQIHQILNKIDYLKKILNDIDIDDLKGNYEQPKIDNVKHNIEVMQEATYFWERFFLGGKYALSLTDPITLKYVPGMNLDISKEEENKLAKKIIGTLTSDLYVLEYENSIKRMILGTMHQNEFNRIYDVLKHKMVKPEKFISLSQYKKDKDKYEL